MAPHGVDKETSSAKGRIATARSVDYDILARTYDRRYAENDYSDVERTLQQFIGDESGLRILEVGCGTAKWLQLVGERGARLTGLDASAGMLARGCQRVPDAALVSGTAERLPFQTKTFDRVFCINAFHHFADKQGFLAEARRVLRPGGRLMTIALDPHVGLDRWCIYDYFQETLDLDKGRYPATAQIRAWMSAAGFTHCQSLEAQHIVQRITAREALDSGRLDKSVTSQLAILTDDEYARGIRRIRETLGAAEARGETLYLDSDLRLYATIGSV